MKIQVLSDLHTEFHKYKIKIDKNADVLVLAGDIIVADCILFLPEMLKNVNIPIIYVAGNHDFYCEDKKITKPMIEHTLKSFEKEIPNFHFLNDESIVIDGIRFIGSTLWSDFNLSDNQFLFAQNVNRAIGDFYVITNGDGTPFRGDDCRDLCIKSKEFILSEAKKEFDGKTVLVTHFCPHPLSIDSRYESHPLNPYFTTDFSEVFYENIDLVIHGHTHIRLDYEFNGIRVVCNPRGCPRENYSYTDKFLVEV